MFDLVVIEVMIPSGHLSNINEIKHDANLLSFQTAHHHFKCKSTQTLQLIPSQERLQGVFAWSTHKLHVLQIDVPNL